MKKHVKAWIGIVIIAWLAAIPITPADPITMLITMAAMLIVAAVAYWLGIFNAQRPHA